ncbi:MAG: hypothetical protein EKK37_06075 [Sphingobacteriales bacterium]|nr:MAG: hypothetical protein EKK37_06075 [Sphingobacteriales bacterium]
MKKLIPVFLLLLLNNIVFSQNYIIRHDLQKEQTKYLRVGKHNDTNKVNISFVIPIQSVYQPGAFLSVSFNFNAITGRKN